MMPILTINSLSKQKDEKQTDSTNLANFKEVEIGYGGFITTITKDILMIDHHQFILIDV